MAISPLYPNSWPIRGYNFAKATSVPPELGFARGSTGTYVGPDGLIKTALVGEPRFNHNPTTGESLGFLVEDARTNGFIYSNTFTDASWGQVAGTTITRTASAAVSPDGTSNATQITATGFNFVRQGATGDTTTIRTFSFFAKAGTASTISARFFSGTAPNSPTANFNLLTGAATVDASVMTASIVPFPNGWYRCICCRTDAVTKQPPDFNFGVGTTFIYGAQLEAGAFSTSYIPTTTTAVTRAADTLSPIILPSSNSSTILVETESIANNTPILSLNDGTTTNEIRLLNHPLAGGSSVVEDGEAITTSVGGSRLYKTTNAISVDNDQIQVVTDNAGFSTTTISSTGLNQISLNGTIKKLYVYDQPFSPLILRGLTTQSKTTPFPPSTEPNLTLGVAIELPNTTWNLRSSGTVNYDVDWGDGQIETTQTSNTKAHTYVSPGIYKVVVKIRSGVFRPFYNNNVDAERIAFIVGTGEGWSFGTSLNAAWYGGFNVVFVDKELNTSTVTDFTNAWRSFSSLLSFPLINTAAGTSFVNAWLNCNSLTSFPLINTAAGTNFVNAWNGCSSLTSFELINTAAGTNFQSAWNGCTSLTSFPLIDTAAGTSFAEAWQNCSSLTSFPLINTAAGTVFASAWRSCNGLTSFPLINTAAGTIFASAWQNCSSLTSFPLINTAAGTIFNNAWTSCSSLTSFPLINTAAGTIFLSAWQSCISLTSFPALNFDSAVGLATVNNVGFQSAWQNCTQLADFPPNLFDNTIATRFLNAFLNCALTATSIENIIVSINTANTSNGTLTLSGGTNATKSTWTTDANTAYDALIARGWTITFNA